MKKVLMLLFAVASATLAEVSMEPVGFNEATITIKNEQMTASDLLAKTAREGYERGVGYLYLRDFTQLVMDANITSNRGGGITNNAELVFREGGITLTIKDNGSSFAWSNPANLTINYAPQTAPTEEEQWLVLDAPAGKPFFIDNRNKTPLTFNATGTSLTNVGVVYSADDIKEGEVGLLVGGYNDKVKNPTFTTLTIVAKGTAPAIPEPTTTVLTLLGVSALARKRRRR